MHGNLSREDTALDTSVPDEDVYRKKSGSDWLVIAALAFGGVLTLAWTAFLLWTLIQILNWMIS
jgi:hypothetical protein